MRRFLIGLAALCALTASADAQKAKKIPKRPRLEAGADTNSAGAYYFYGLARLMNQPREAEAAFYWASRLDPTAPEPLYARWIAYWAADTERLFRYFMGQKHVVEDKEVVALDSLLDQALLRDPFLHRALERALWEQLIRDATGEVMMSSDWGTDAYSKGWISYTRGEFGIAAVRFGEVLKKKSDNTQARIYLARSLYWMEQYDSSAAEFARVVDQMRKKDQKKLVYFYQSKAHMEYAIGMIHERAGALTKAKESYGRALTEDLSFYMAHARLAEVAMAMGDTAEALHEHDQAVELRQDDAYVRFAQGLTLVRLKRGAEAAERLRKVIEMEPHFAVAYLNLAAALEMDGKYQDAVENYKAFLARAPRAMEEQIALATEKVKALDGKTAANSGGGG